MCLLPSLDEMVFNIIFCCGVKKFLIGYMASYAKFNSKVSIYVSFSNIGN